MWGLKGPSLTLYQRLGCTVGDSQSNLLHCRQPSIVEIQILRVGQFVILCVPGELTTMAGRRLREAMQAQVVLLCCHASCCDLMLMFMSRMHDWYTLDSRLA